MAAPTAPRPPRSIADVDVTTAELEARIEEIREAAHKKVPNPDGDHVECWHQFLDIDPDLAGRDYTQPGGTK